MLKGYHESLNALYSKIQFVISTMMKKGCVQ